MPSDTLRSAPRFTLRSAALLCGGGLGIAGCGDEAAEPVRFDELAAPAAPAFEHTFDTDTAFYITESIASGVALLDYDLDGDMDVYAVDGAGRPGRLFRNEGDRFVDAPEGSGFGALPYGSGVSAADFDNDGRPDLYLASVDDDALYRNTPDGFVDVTDMSGIANPDWGTSATWLDYDADGHLDVFVVNYLRLLPGVECSDRAGALEYCGPTAYPGVPDRLFRNLGDGTFADVSAETGIGALPGRGLGVAAADFDGDGDVDIYVANDGEPNFLWENRGDGTFRDVATSTGTAVNGAGLAEAGMGVALGDVDGDRWPDLFLTHLSGESNTLYRNRGDGTFADETSARGLHAASLPVTGFGTAMGDLDNDGDLDIVVVNGRINRGAMTSGIAGDPLRAYAEPNHVYLNEGDGRFARTTGDAFASRPGMSRGLAVGDLDDDGSLDLLVAETGRELRVFRNAGEAGAWIGFRVTDPGRGGRDAIGAVVTAWPVDGAAQRRDVAPNVGYLSSHDPRVHFGIGSSSGVDSLRVRWVDGAVEVFGSHEGGRYHEVRRGGGAPR